MAEQTRGWSALLDELDRQLVRARRPLNVAVTAPGVWDLDTIRASFEPLGELPAELTTRAGSILRTYEMVVSEMQATQRGIAEQLTVLQALRGQHQQGPVYFDRVG
ncbi:MAG TPA: hypothetical protein VGF80_12760 [Galbitalea sp.]